LTRQGYYHAGLTHQCWWRDDPRGNRHTPAHNLPGTGLLFRKLESELEINVTDDIITSRLLPDDAFEKRNIELLYPYHWMSNRPATL